jgi:hypothetical protein
MVMGEFCRLENVVLLEFEDVIHRRKRRVRVVKRDVRRVDAAEIGDASRVSEYADVAEGNGHVWSEERFF